MPLHGVESLALGPHPPKHQQQHIPGYKRTQAPDGGEEAHKRALAHITVNPAAHCWVLHLAHGVLMAAQASTPERDPEDPPRGRQQLFQATTLTGREGAPWEALHTALYWAQGSPNGLDTPEPTEAWVMQAKAMRNYHLHHPFDDSPAALPWPSNPPETVRKLADLMCSHAKAKTCKRRQNTH